VTWEKNSPTEAHAGHKRRLQWLLPGALGCSWSAFALGLINRLDWPSRFGVGQQADILSP